MPAFVLRIYGYCLYDDGAGAYSSSINRIDTIDASGTVKRETISLSPVGASTARATPIALPNGAKYDPQQNYNAPLVPGTIEQVIRVVAPNNGYVTGVVTEFVQILGYKVRLVADFGPGSGTLYATARMAQCVTQVAAPFYPQYTGGESLPTKRAYQDVNIVWEMFTDWEGDLQPS